MKYALAVVALLTAPLSAQAYCTPPTNYAGAENAYVNQLSQSQYQNCLNQQMQRQQREIESLRQNQQYNNNPYRGTYRYGY